MSTWIFLRGLTRETRHWGDFPRFFQDEFPDDRIIALDLPGNGEFNALSSPLRIDKMASHCRKELARQGVLPPYCLLAMSMGGMVASAWAQQHPREIEACVLINTSFNTFNSLDERMRPTAWPKLLRLVCTSNPRRREQLVFNLTSRLAEPPAGLLDQWVAWRQARPVRVQNALRQLLAAARFRAPATAPAWTLVLASAHDRLVNVQCSTEIARRWNCAIATHPTAGHDLPLDDGRWVAREIRAWLTSSSLRR
ncbi:MAG: alpha/beta hydrolase [Usitatibacteraceae bacterium]